MPIYEYECLKCGNKFEVRRGFIECDDTLKCPKCEAENPRRVFSPFATGKATAACGPTGST